MEINDLFDAESVTLSDEFICGYVDKEGKVYCDFIVEAMSGEAEDVIDGAGPRIPIFNRFILLCLRSIGPYTDQQTLAHAVEKMTSLDRLIALIAIRRATHKNIYNMIVPMPDDCPDDTRRFKVDLSKFPRTPMVDQAKRKRVDVVTIDGLNGPIDYKVHWHIMIGADEMWAEKVQSKTRGESKQTVNLLSRVDGLTRVGKDGVADVHVEIERGKILADSKMLSEQLKGALKLVKSFPATLRRKISTLIDDVEGDIDIILEFEYRDKDNEETSFKTLLDPTQKEFFFPRVRSSNSKTTSSTSASSGE